jgi:hypothetical protein
MSPASLGADIGRQGNPNSCTDPYAPSYYLGRPGALTQIKMPAANVSRQLDDRFAVHELLERQAVDRSPYGCRTWGIEYEWLKPTDMSVLMEYATRQRGFGPFIFIDPQMKNILTPNQASGTDALHTSEGFSADTTSAYGVSDTFTRTVVDGFGTNDTGQAYTLSGTAADFDVAAGVGTIQPTTLNSDRLAYVTADRGANRTVKVEGAFATLPATGSLRFGVIMRLADTSNYYIAVFQVTSAGATSLFIAKRAGGVGSTIFTNSSLAHVPSGSVTAGTFYTVKAEISGSSIKAKVFPTSLGDSLTWDIDDVDAAVATGTFAGVFARNETAVTTHIMRLDNFTSTSLETESLSSSSIAARQGERSLAWGLPSTVVTGVLTLDPPTGLLGWSIPSGTSWAFSGSLRSSGGDTTIQLAPVLTWKTTGGIQSGPAVTGSTVTLNDSAWQSFCVTGSAPIDGFVTIQLVASSASVTGTGTVLVDQLQFEQGSSCTTWEYGQGQPLVGIRADSETIPRILRTNVGFTILEVT